MLNMSVSRLSTATNLHAIANTQTRYSRTRLLYLRIAEQIHQSIDAVSLVQSDRSHRLFPHGALIRISGRLVVMRVRYQPGAYAQQSKRLDLERKRHDCNRAVDSVRLTTEFNRHFNIPTAKSTPTPNIFFAQLRLLTLLQICSENYVYYI